MLIPIGRLLAYPGRVNERGGVIEAPYLLYLGEATDPLSAKTGRGIAHWRPQLALGQMRSSPATVSLGFPELSFAEAVARGTRTLVIGVANAGGVMSGRMVDDIVAALEAGLDVASGLHQRLAAQPRIASAAAARDRRLWDVREPPANLPVGTGARRVGKRLLTVGTDCAVGKMYTALSLERELRGRGLAADFRATGQTGILIAGEGMPVDAVVADFISGAVERLSPARDDGGWDLIEGQGSLFHPGFAGVSLGLLHGAQPDALVLCHEAGRTRMRHAPGFPVPDLARCLERNLEAAWLTSPGAVAVGVALNTSALDRDSARRACDDVEAALGLPCQDPVVDGMGRVVERLLEAVQR
nr:N-acetyltransferase DgcN [Sphingomonas sp. CROZ-RG-20F-R02-07]